MLVTMTDKELYGVGPEKRNLWSLPFLQHPFVLIIGLLESIRRLNGILFPRLDEFRA